MMEMARPPPMMEIKSIRKIKTPKNAEQRKYTHNLVIRVLQRSIFLETTPGKPGTLLITPIFSILAPKICQKINLGGWTTQLKIFSCGFSCGFAKFCG